MFWYFISSDETSSGEGKMSKYLLCIFGLSCTNTDVLIPFILQYSVHITNVSLVMLCCVPEFWTSVSEIIWHSTCVQMFSAVLSDWGSSRGKGHGAHCVGRSQTYQCIPLWPVCWGTEDTHKRGMSKDLKCGSCIYTGCFVLNDQNICTYTNALLFSIPNYPLFVFDCSNTLFLIYWMYL